MNQALTIAPMNKDIFSERLRAMIEKRNLKQHHVAAVCKKTDGQPVSNATVSLWVSTNPDARTRPDFKHYAPLARLLDVSLDYLFGLNDDYNHASDNDPRQHHLDWTIYIQKVIDDFEAETGHTLSTKARAKWIRKAYFEFAERQLPTTTDDITTTTLMIRRLYGAIK